MKKYNKYKPTKIEYLEAIPSHWDEKRMRYIGFLFGGLSGKSANDFNQTDHENNKYFIPFTNISGNLKINISDLQSVVVGENENQNSVEKGDLFFLMSSEDYDDVGKSSVLADDIPEETYLNSFCKGLRITDEKVHPEYLNYHLHSKQLRYNLLTEANGFTRINLKIGKVLDLFVAFPSLEEQIAIAKYLDRKTAEMDELIASKKRLLELYDEEKIAIINQAVTKGLNPFSNMKESGIEWLGEVPEHWDLIKLKKSLDLITNGYVGPTRDILQKSGVKYIQSLHIKNYKIEFHTPYYVSEEWSNKHSRSQIKDGDILLVQTGAGTGNLGLVSMEYEGSNCHALIILRPNQEIINPNFLLNFLLSSYGFHTLKSIQTGALHPHLNSTIVCDIEILLPPKEEQDQINQLIREKLGIISNKILNTMKLIDLLKEYRTALISEVVTGRIKVI